LLFSFLNKSYLFCFLLKLFVVFDFSRDNSKDDDNKVVLKLFSFLILKPFKKDAYFGAGKKSNKSFGSAFFLIRFLYLFLLFLNSKERFLN